MALFYLVPLLLALLVLGNTLLRIAGRRKAQFILTTVVLALLALLFAYMIFASASGSYLQIIKVDPFSLFFGLLFTIGFLLFNLLAYTSKEYGNIALISGFSLAGMYLVVSTLSLVAIFIGLELVAIPSVFIILLSRRSVEAAVKFFIMASISIALLSFAIVMLFGLSNSLALSSYSGAALAGFVAALFIVSLSFEASIFPFNVLIPDVYEGSSASVVGLLGGVNKKAGLAVLMQVLILVFITDKSLFLLVAILSVITMTYGNVVAILQNNLKRMLAYSSISQAGYILIGIAVANQAGLTASLFQIFAHMFIFIGIMAIFAVLEAKNRLTVDEFIGLNNENRFAAFALSLFMLALIGLPFTTGFIGKFLLFLSAVNSGLIWLAIIGILNSAVSIAYYTKVLMSVYANKEHASYLPIDKRTTAVIVICLAVTLVFGIYPGPIINLAGNAAHYLLMPT